MRTIYFQDTTCLQDALEMHSRCTRDAAGGNLAKLIVRCEPAQTPPHRDCHDVEASWSSQGMDAL